MKWAVGLCGLGGGRDENDTPRQVGARNDKGGRDEIVAPSIHGAGCRARNDKGAWWCTKETATKCWRRDLHLKVSSFFLGFMSKTSIPAHEAFSTGRVPVGRGR